jgi:DNA-binding beta-propeller fold protein YncE
VTAETQNRLLAVDLHSGRVLRRLAMPADPQNVEANAQTAVVVSTRAGAVTLVDVPSLRIRKTIRGFRAPHIAALSPDGRYVYVTDDGSGRLVVIALREARVVQRLFVCFGAHHLSFRPHHRQVWIACGERARTIAIVNTANFARPRRLGFFDPGILAHDLAFPAGGRRLWVATDDSTSVAVFDARTRRRVFTRAVGLPPQHVAIERYVYVTSGNDSRLRIFSVGGVLLGTATIPYGSYNLSLGAGRVLTSSLANGTLTELGVSGRLLLSERVAPAARDASLVP